ncbi:type II toxin-antitoxin system RelE/ParE family toxin [Pasteurellaceae bacterium LIM206]|nr:type II toxin-antitoxin system RelE/ParE family toxin [Pasteurellaceae bacterium LIM206]
MTYSLEFKKQALKEFEKLSDNIANKFLDKLAERLENPRVESAKLRSMEDCYKIKLRASGYRLVYQVIDDRIVVEVIAVGRRDRQAVYHTAKKRL